MKYEICEIRNTNEGDKECVSNLLRGPHDERTLENPAKVRVQY